MDSFKTRYSDSKLVKMMQANYMGKEEEEKEEKNGEGGGKRSEIKSRRIKIRIG